MIAYKLFRVRKDGTLGSLFINPRARLPIGEWVEAEAYETKGFAYRPGWHSAAKPNAPHLSTRGRRWFKVQIQDFYSHQRPANQGGLWYTSRLMKILKEV